MFTKNKFQYCIYNHERLELHELQKEYQKDKARTKLKYENQLFCPGCYKVDLVINEKKGKIYWLSHPKSPHADGCEYALESASKKELKEYYDSYIQKCVSESNLVIACWGNHGKLLNRDKALMGSLPNLVCLKRNKNGTPHHPLYLSKDVTPMPYK